MVHYELNSRIVGNPKFPAILALGWFNKRPADLSDMELIARYRNTGDTVYVGELYQRYTHLILLQCRKYLKRSDECEDAAMEVFEKIMTELKRHDVENFKPWLFTIARNHCLKKLRHKNTVITTDDVELVAAHGTTAPDTVSDMEAADRKEFMLENLEDGIRHLTDEQRQCVELFYLKAKSYQDIAAHTGFSLNQVKSYIQNGKRNLKNYLLSRDGS